MSDLLIRRIEENRDLRARVKLREEDYNSQVKTVREAADSMMLDFWCRGCQKDFSAVGYKREGTFGMWPTAWYVAKCLCGAQVIRRITDKSKDSYFRDSRNIKFQRVRNFNDMLTPADDLFKIIYPKEYERITGNATREE